MIFLTFVRDTLENMEDSGCKIPRFFIGNPHQKPIVQSSMYILSEFAYNKLMPYPAKVRDVLLNLINKDAIIIYILCQIRQKLEVIL